jgi:D-alanyl-lipoteichoic acid acyltransferase DltB (MBOAT superfamily)
MGASPTSRASVCSLFGIAVNIALLGYFKYRNFLASSAGVLPGSSWHLPTLVLPLAVSISTFEQITYLVTAYRGDPGTGDFINYCMFIAFLPPSDRRPYRPLRRDLPAVQS